MTLDPDKFFSALQESDLEGKDREERIELICVAFTRSDPELLRCAALSQAEATDECTRLTREQKALALSIRHERDESESEDHYLALVFVGRVLLAREFVLEFSENYQRIKPSFDAYGLLRRYWMLRTWFLGIRLREPHCADVIDDVLFDIAEIIDHELCDGQCDRCRYKTKLAFHEAMTDRFLSYSAVQRKIDARERDTQLLEQLSLCRHQYPEFRFFIDRFVDKASAPCQDPHCAQCGFGGVEAMNRALEAKAGQASNANNN